MEKNFDVIAHYLPQFHPIPQNDEWWGDGFTEWRNVVKAKPLFAGHYQPHLPKHLGYYDLRLFETIQAQEEMAIRYGVDVFCYYHYWFDGLKLLDTPINVKLGNADLRMPLMVCWANENWTRRWDGLDEEVLLAQTYSSDDARSHGAHLATILSDDRYYCVDGCPVLAIYRPRVIPDETRYVEILKEEIELRLNRSIKIIHCASQGGSYSINSETFAGSYDFFPNNKLGLRQLRAPLRGKIEGKLNIRVNHYNRNKVYSYREYVELLIESWSSFGNKKSLGVVPCWDNSARRINGGAWILHGSTPDLWEKLLRAAKAEMDRRNEHQMFFINAWNEWAEGAHLEPDERWGLSYLEKVRSVFGA